jgi:hypothetical protein
MLWPGIEPRSFVLKHNKHAEPATHLALGTTHSVQDRACVVVDYWVVKKVSECLKVGVKLEVRRFYRVLTMVYNTQNCWGFGLYPSSGF